MHPHRHYRRSGNWHGRFVIGLLAAACLALGMLGLLLPIIPGILFLGVAIILLSRISSRVDRWRRETPAMARFSRRAHALGRLSWSDRLSAGFWLALGSVIEGVRGAVGLVRKMAGRNSAARND